MPPTTRRIDRSLADSPAALSSLRSSSTSTSGGGPSAVTTIVRLTTSTVATCHPGTRRPGLGDRSRLRRGQLIQRDVHGPDAQRDRDEDHEGDDDREGPAAEVRGRLAGGHRRVAHPVERSSRVPVRTIAATLVPNSSSACGGVGVARHPEQQPDDRQRRHERDGDGDAGKGVADVAAHEGEGARRCRWRARPRRSMRRGLMRPATCELAA